MYDYVLVYMSMYWNGNMGLNVSACIGLGTLLWIEYDQLEQY